MMKIIMEYLRDPFFLLIATPAVVALLIGIGTGWVI